MDAKRLRYYIMEYKQNKLRLDEINTLLEDGGISVTAAYGERSGVGHKVLDKTESAYVRNEKLREEYRHIAEQVQVVDLAIGICLDSEDTTHQILFTVLDSNKGLRKIAYDMGITYQQARTRFHKAIQHCVGEMERDSKKVL